MKRQLANIILFHRKRSSLTQVELAEMADRIISDNPAYSAPTLLKTPAKA